MSGINIVYLHMCSVLASTHINRKVGVLKEQLNREE